MDWKKVILQEGLADFPVGLGGCRVTDTSFDLCDYDISVFDDKTESDKIVTFDDKLVHIHHSSLKETKSEILVQYDQMKILQDDSWELRMFLSKIQEKRDALFKDFAKNCLIESLFCCKKTTDGLDSSHVFASCWQKCASYYLADAICALNKKKPSPSHMLDLMRKFEKNSINKEISVVNEAIGIERATPVLLERMLKSTIGFSEQIEKNNHFEEIQQKHDFFVNNSMMSDCYFYLGYINKTNFVRLKNHVEKQPELIHILKIAFDLEVDSELIRQHSGNTQKACRQILENVFQA
ncbi:hypothetical protein NsoK4_06055 [Nitrosopumilus sp. K4]|uniref:hypothetical protein n=1 Tax=Nitrosopumilus sp. K4 TaxID=2795383 RepID=UPI001BAE07C8|nr:hypothetical protein [Nitrosopumilus sp. K4]QUC64019.1 hypothetical protein NsoK4_06055 [Nitrosopumilus sp. K4]